MHAVISRLIGVGHEQGSNERSFRTVRLGVLGSCGATVSEVQHLYRGRIQHAFLLFENGQSFDWDSNVLIE